MNVNPTNLFNHGTFDQQTLDGNEAVGYYGDIRPVVVSVRPSENDVKPFGVRVLPYEHGIRPYKPL